MNHGPTQPTPSIECPRCGSSFGEYLKDADTGDIVRPEDRRLFVCMVCRHIFPVFADESPSIMRDVVGTPIEGDRKCPGCGYNLRTLKIGGRCPECAWSIRPEVTWTRPEGDGPWTHWDTIVAIVWSLAFVAMVIEGSAAKVPSAVSWGALGLLFVANGCRGLATGRVMIISRSIFQRTAKGRWGFVVSVLYVVLGLAMGRYLPHFIFTGSNWILSCNRSWRSRVSVVCGLFENDYTRDTTKAEEFCHAIG